MEARRQALKRWLVFALSWQALVVVGVFAYAFVATHLHSSGFLWAAPPVAALVGTALPYQLAASRLVRALTQ